MISIKNSAEMERALGLSLGAQLRHLLLLRKAQLTESGEYDLGELAHFIVVSAGDSLADVEAELGFSLTTNFVDGARFGDPDFTPSWEWIEAHGQWFELVYVLTDDGFGKVVFVPDDREIDPKLQSLCRTYAQPSRPGEGC